MTDTAGDTTGATPDIKESFASLLEESFGNRDDLVGTVVVGTVIAIENDMAVVDVGLKSEGRVPVKEFSVQGQAPDVGVGSTVEVYLERMENLKRRDRSQSREGSARGGLGEARGRICQGRTRQRRDIRAGEGRLYGRPLRCRRVLAR